MTEITQADRDAANKWIDTTPGIKDWVGYQEERDIAEAFARIRQQAAAEERAKIVAWLRGLAEEKGFLSVEDIEQALQETER